VIDITNEDTSVEVDLTMPDLIDLTDDDEFKITEEIKKLTKKAEEIKEIQKTVAEIDENEPEQKVVEKELFDTEVNIRAKERTRCGPPLLTALELHKQNQIRKDKAFLNLLTEEKLDEMFPISYDKVLEEETKRHNEQDKSIALKKKEFEMRRMMGMYKDAQYFEEDKSEAHHATKKDIRDWRYYNYAYYASEIKNGYYKGWLSTCRCKLCDEILSCFPSSYKRIYWLPNTRCPFCTGLYNRIDRTEAEQVRYKATKWKAHHKTSRHQQFWISDKKI